MKEYQFGCFIINWIIPGDNFNFVIDLGNKLVMILSICLAMGQQSCFCLCWGKLLLNAMSPLKKYSQMFSKLL